MERKLKLRGIFLLKCPYCLETNLRKKSSWFEFDSGCPQCNYRFEREPGYFFASPWMINYPISAIVCFIFSYIMFQKMPDLAPLMKASFVAGVCIVTALILFPFSRAVWMFADHLFHPLSDEDLPYSENNVSK